MKKLLILLFVLPTCLLAQVGIGTTTPHVSSVLEISSTEAGILIPRMTQVQRDAIGTPETGLLIYQTNNSPGFYYYTGVIWTTFGGGADNDWTIHANGVDMYNANTGNVGVGTNTPTTKFHVESSGGGATDLTQDFETTMSPFTGDWILQGTNVNGGVQAVRSAVIGHSSSSSMETTVTVPVASTVSFFKEVSSEATWDVFRFYIDGVEFGGGWSGNVPYSQETFALTAGTHTLKWEFSRDSSDDGGANAAYVDDVVITNAVPDTAIRIVDGSEASGHILTSDANGNASWQPLTNSSITDIPLVASFQGMEIPICDNVNVGTTGNFNITVKGVATTVNWEVLVQNTAIGTTANISGNEVLLAPFNAERLQVRYDFTPALPFAPQGLIFTANNTSSFPDTFSLNYGAKSATSITMNITRTDKFGDHVGGSVNCWRGQFYFDVLMTD